MKVLLAAAAGLLCSCAASADSFDTVSLAPTTITVPGLTAQETVSLSFTWDTTTNALSNFVLNTVGPVGGFNSTPTTELFTSSGIDLLNFTNGTPGTNLQISNEGSGSGTVIPSSAGTYDRPVFLTCAGCQGHGTGDGVVTVSTSIAAAEPGTLALLGVGLVGFLLRKPKKPAISANWEPLA